VLRGSPPPQAWWIEHCHVWRFFLESAGRLEPAALSPEQRASGRELVGRLYQQMQRECVALGCAFLLVCHHASWLQDSARREGLRHLDVTHVFERLEELGPTRFPDDGHWLPHVHEAIADEVLVALDGLGVARR